MSLDIEILSEAYSILKEYIPSKDRQAAADNLLSMMGDLLTERELKEFGGTDSYTKRSVEEYVNYSIDDDLYDDDYDDSYDD